MNERTILNIKKQNKTQTSFLLSKRPKLKIKPNCGKSLITVLLIQALGLLTICKAVVMMLICFNGIEM